MGVILPFIVGAVVGGVAKWQLDRMRDQDDNGQSRLKKWIPGKKEQSSSSEVVETVVESAEEAAESSSGSQSSSS